MTASGPDLRDLLAGLAAPARAAFLASLDARELEGLVFDWEGMWARPSQRLPPGDWRTWLLMAGRGFGKTRVLSETVRIWARDPAARIGLCARTATDLRSVLVEGPSGVLSVFPSREKPLYEPALRRIRFASGAQAMCLSAEEPDLARGPNFSHLACDELATWSSLDEMWSNLMLALRVGPHPRAVVATTPKPLRLLRDLASHPSTVLTRGTTYDNVQNLAGSALAEFRARYGEVGRLARQEIFGELLDDAEEAMFRREWFAVVGEAPADAKRLRYWDLAATPDKPGADPDWTVGAKLGLKDGVWYVVDLVRLRGTPMAVERAVRAAAESDGERVPVVMEEEPGSAGKSVIDHYSRHVLVGFTFRGDRKTGNKIELAGPLSAAAQAGNVKLLRAPWNGPFLDEVSEFPMGAHDDQVDAVAGAMRMLRSPMPGAGLLAWTLAAARAAGG